MQRSAASLGKPGVKLLRNSLWLPTLIGRTLTRKQNITGVKVYVGVHQMLQREMQYGYQRNALWQPNLVVKNLVKSKMH